MAHFRDRSVWQNSGQQFPQASVAVEHTAKPSHTSRKQDYKKTRPMLRATRLKAEAKKTAVGIKTGATRLKPKSDLWIKAYGDLPHESSEAAELSSHLRLFICSVQPAAVLSMIRSFCW
ncbi:triple QxxK/R motif-containing protein isoform X2 [Heliangelus exortis]|uniref:triple QxxK/R motif-containing protein isoform X2 n=1 Tax=Heliangelus exortis TaxID=472823 RepID=UPI003A934EFD